MVGCRDLRRDGPGGQAWHRGDPNGTGEARFIFYPNKNSYTIQVSGIDRATSAHLHEAPAGQNAPVKLGERFIKKISGNPTGYYADVHNGEFPGGANKGQPTQGGSR